VRRAVGGAARRTGRLLSADGSTLSKKVEMGEAGDLAQEWHANRNSLEASLPFIEKPYSLDALLLPIREALSGE
jgi:hypothetical protein